MVGAHRVRDFPLLAISPLPSRCRACPRAGDIPLLLLLRAEDYHGFDSQVLTQTDVGGQRTAPQAGVGAGALRNRSLVGAVHCWYHTERFTSAWGRHHGI